jgi:ATP-dependent RNA helicase DDX24/MAK5
MSKNKRKTAVAGLAAAPAKRQKLGGLKAGLSKKKRAVNLDSLSWTPVDIPEMFNDAEGFYNLEMIEGVEVVKDGDNVEFVRRPVGPHTSSH